MSKGRKGSELAKEGQSSDLSEKTSGESIITMRTFVGRRFKEHAKKRLSGKN